MKILFLTISQFTDVEQKGIYTDLMRKFRDEGHSVYVVTPLERRYKKETSLKENKGIHILGVKTLNMQKCSFIEKGVGILLVEYQFKKAIKKYLKVVGFDLVLFSTPPITFTKSVKYVKDQCHAKTYLLLKDIFPQNAIDIGIMKKNGLLHKFFIRKELKLYKTSDYIGCMSNANVNYILTHNRYLNKQSVEVNPNSIDVLPVKSIDKDAIREYYKLPKDKKIFVYGGNLGKPQAVNFIIECLNANKNRKDCFFIIVGSGTEYQTIYQWINNTQPDNILLQDYLPTEQYNNLLACCDVGMIFLDYRFTIPNYPSRLLSYLNNKLPVLIATDINCDMGAVATENNFGTWCPSNDVKAFSKEVDNYLYKYDIITMGENGYRYLLDNYTVGKSYQIIMNHF